MRTLWNEIWSFLKKAWFTVPVILTTLFSYGYSLSHVSINADDLAEHFYLDEKLYVTVGRPVWWLLEKYSGVMPVHPFVTGLSGVLGVLLATTCFCVLLQRASEDHLPTPAYPVFACLFISYPMQFEAWICDRNSMMFGFSYLCVALALLVMQRFIDGGGWIKVLIAAVLLLLNTLMYESFLLVYVCGVFILLLVRWIYGTEDDRIAWRFVVKGLLCAIPLAAALLIKAVFYNGRGGAFGRYHILDRIKSLLIRWVLTAKWSFSVQIFLGAVLIACICGIVLHVRYKKGSVWLLLAGCIGSPFLFDFLLNVEMSVRAYQAVAVLVAAVGMLVAACLTMLTKRQWLRGGCYALLFFLCFRQAVEMDRGFVLKEQEYREEAETARCIYSRLITEFDIEKPVQFVGLYMPSESIMRQCAVTKDDPTCRMVFRLMGTDAEWYRYFGAGMYYHFQWCLEAFSGEGESAYYFPGNMFERFFEYEGLRGVHVGDREGYIKANAAAIDMPSWPAKESIRDMGDYTVVKLGDLWIPPDGETSQIIENESSAS